MKKFKPYHVFVGLFAALWAFISIMPFYLMILTSLKAQRDYSSNGFFSFPLEFKFENYAKVFERGIASYFINSIIVLCVSLSILLLVALLAAYPLSRLRFSMRQPVTSFVIACMAVPMHVTLIPIFLLTQKMGVYDSIAGLVGPYVAFNLPITIYILSSFMETIPGDLEESAKIDGCNIISCFFRIIVPLTLPGIVTVAIYDAIHIWNEFSFVMVLTQSERARTIPLAIWNYKGQYSSNVPLLFAVLVVSSAPMIIAFIFFQDKIVKGMMAGAVKG